MVNKGLKVGKYHETYDLQDVVDEYFGAKVFPTFSTQGDHVVLNEICSLPTEDDGEVLDHPMAYMLPRGKFLIRNF